MDNLRRHLLGAGALGAASLLFERRVEAGAAADSTRAPSTPGDSSVAADSLAPDVVPPLPASPPPGRPGDFDFLTGEWRIRNRSLVNGEWLEYPGEATVYRILAGGGSVEDLRIPSRSFAGMGLRLLDVEKQVWSDHWVNARSGVVATPGETGGFVDGVGMFSSTYEENGRVTIAAGIWEAITPRSCRWRQVVSDDGGGTWRHTWIMRWSRVG